MGIEPYAHGHMKGKCHQCHNITLSSVILCFVAFRSKVMMALAWKTVTSTGVTHPISACWLDKSGYSTALSKQCQKYWPLISNLPNDDRNGKSVVLKRGWGVLYDLALNATCNPKPETLCQPFWSASFDKMRQNGVLSTQSRPRQLSVSACCRA